MADLKQTLKEADEMLRIARTALQKMRLEGLGSDCRLSHEVRMFALEFSRESRDGPGVLQVNGTGRALKCLEAIRDALAQSEPVQSAARVDAYDMIDRFLRNNLRDDDYAEYSAALDSLYTAAQQAEPVQEPVAWMFELARNFNLEGYGGWEKRITEYRPNTPEGSVRNVTPLYTSPPQRKPLTEDEIAELTQSYPASSMWRLIVSTARAIERAHGIKEAK